ncbi:MAG: signal peptidase I [Nocardioidaceae bacterium]
MTTQPPDAESGIPAASDVTEHPLEPTSHVSEQRHSLPLWQEVLVLLVMALGLAIVIKTFFVQAFYIPSGSMNDTLVKNDRILVEKMSYWFGDVQRGDVVVFDDPGGWLTPEESTRASNPVTRGLEFVGLYPAGGHLVKRVIGVGGDHVECCTKGLITVNGVPLHEQSYLGPGDQPSQENFSVNVPTGDLWVMGDNRDNSADSRAHLGSPGGGFVPENDVVGKVFVVVWPFSDADWLSRPDTFGQPGLEAISGIEQPTAPLLLGVAAAPPLFGVLRRSRRSLTRRGPG